MMTTPIFAAMIVPRAIHVGHSDGTDHDHDEGMALMSSNDADDDDDDDGADDSA